MAAKNTPKKIWGDPQTQAVWDAAPNAFNDSYWDEIDRQAAQRAGLKAAWLLPAIRTRGEKSNADQISSAGARTPYQITPKTRRLFLKAYGVDAWSSPQNAATVAALHLKESLDRRPGNYRRAVREYHGGPDSTRWGDQNDQYHRRVLGEPGKMKVPADQSAEPPIDFSQYRQIGPGIYEPMGGPQRDDETPLPSIPRSSVLPDFISGADRETEWTDQAKDWSEIPDADLRTILGTLTAGGAEEIGEVLKNGLQGYEYARDEKNNWIFRKKGSEQLYSVKPGFRSSDIPRVLGQALPFSIGPVAGPISKGASALTALARGGGLTRAAAGAIGKAAAVGAAGGAGIEGLSYAGGGTFDPEGVAAGALAAPGEAAMGAVFRGAGSGLRRGAQAAGAGARNAAGRIRSAMPGGSAVPDDALTRSQNQAAGLFGNAVSGNARRAAEAQGAIANAAGLDTEALAAFERSGIETPAPMLFTDDTARNAAAYVAREGPGSLREQTAAVGPDVANRAERLFGDAAQASLGDADDSVRQAMRSRMDDLKVQSDELYDVVNRRIVPGVSETPSAPQSPQAAYFESLNRRMADQAGVRSNATYSPDDIRDIENYAFETGMSTDDAIRQLGINPIVQPPSILPEPRAPQIKSLTAPGNGALAKLLAKRAGELGGPENLPPGYESRLYRQFGPESFEILPDGRFNAEYRMDGPTYVYLDQARKAIGERLGADGALTGVDKQYYAALSADQEKIAQRFGVLDELKEAQAAFKQRVELGDDYRSLFGTSGEGENNLTAALSTEIKNLGRGSGEKMARLIQAMPPAHRKTVMATAVNDFVTGRGADAGFNPVKFAKWHEDLMKNRVARNVVLRNLPADARARLSDLATMSRAVNRWAGSLAKLTDKSPFAARLSGRGSAGETLAAIAAGGIIGGPSGGVLGGFLMRAGREALRQGSKSGDIVAAVDRLLASKEFTALAVRAAKAPSSITDAELARIANSSMFRDLAGKLGIGKNAASPRSGGPDRASRISDRHEETVNAAARIALLRSIIFGANGGEADYAE